MKKLITIFAAILMTASVFAQAPQKMSYQAVIRNASNALITSTTVGMRISILQGSSSGTSVYTETQTISTNANGLVSLEVGTGTIVTGTFAGINWANGPYFIKTETDPTGGTAYTIAGTNELMSVPYALFAPNGGGWALTGNIATATDFIGTTNPAPFNIKVNSVKAGRIDSAPLYNAFYGYQSGLNTSTGVDNTGIGTNALSFNTTGVNNTATGRSALEKNTGSNNTADGKSALQNNTSGIGNTASGLNSLHSNTSGNFNTAVGYTTLDANTTGTNNTAIGYGADVSTGALTNATAIGYNAKVGASNSLILGGTGVDEVNVGVGTTNPTVKLDVEQGTLRVNRKTSDHTNPHVRVSDDDNSNDFGGISNATGVAGFFIPSFTAKSNVAGWLGSGDASNTFITVNADDNQTPSRRAAMAFDARNYDNTGPLLQKDLFSWGSFVGGSGGATYMSMDHQGNLGIGTTTPSFKLDVTGNASVSNMPNNSSAPYVVVSNSTGGQLFTKSISELVGSETDWHVTGNAGTIDANDFIGTTDAVPFNIRVNNVKAGRIDHTKFNAFYGYQSGLNTSTGVDNTGIGTNALSFNTTGVNNTATGRSALEKNTGSNNTADGKSALQNNTSGIGNTASGLNSLHSNTSGNFNTAVGYTTLDANTTGSNNTALGYGADVVGLGPLTNATAIGYNAKVGASNSLILGGTGVDEVNVGIGTTTPTVKLDIEQGTVRVNRKTSDHSNPHIRVSDDDNATDFGGITNATGAPGFFIPSFSAKSNVLGWPGGDASNVFFTVQADDNVNSSRKAAMAFDARNYTNTGRLLQKDLFSWGSFVGGSGGATYMSMDAGGNLGIGTTDPGAKLEVNGTVKITDGSQGLGYVLTSDAVGLASWQPIPPATGGGCGTCHFIGESYGGGVVYYVYDGGQHGLIIANNYSEVPWWNGTPRFTGTTGDGVNAGAMNTTLIVAAQYADNPTTGNFAAKVCADFIAGGFGDWYLPSKMELNLLFLQSTNPLLLSAGLTFPPQWQYWSSTEFNATEAENQLFDSGTQQHNSKANIGIARAVRSF